MFADLHSKKKEGKEGKYHQPSMRVARGAGNYLFRNANSENGNEIRTRFSSMNSRKLSEISNPNQRISHLHLHFGKGDILGSLSCYCLAKPITRNFGLDSSFLLKCPGYLAPRLPLSLSLSLSPLSPSLFPFHTYFCFLFLFRFSLLSGNKREKIYCSAHRITRNFCLAFRGFLLQAIRVGVFPSPPVPSALYVNTQRTGACSFLPCTEATQRSTKGNRTL